MTHRTTITTDYYVYESQQMQKGIFFHLYLKSWNGHKHAHRNLT